MSRKARISQEEKEAFGRPRLYALRGSYGPLKLNNATFDGAVVVLDDGSAREDERPLASVVAHAAAARTLTLGADEATAAPIIALGGVRPFAWGGDLGCALTYSLVRRFWACSIVRRDAGGAGPRRAAARRTRRRPP